MKRAGLDAPARTDEHIPACRIPASERDAYLEQAEDRAILQPKAKVHRARCRRTAIRSSLRRRDPLQEKSSRLYEEMGLRSSNGHNDCHCHGMPAVSISPGHDIHRTSATVPADSWCRSELHMRKLASAHTVPDMAVISSTPDLAADAAALTALVAAATTLRDTLATLTTLVAASSTLDDALVTLALFHTSTALSSIASVLAITTPAAIASFSGVAFSPTYANIFATFANNFAAFDAGSAAFADEFAAFANLAV